MIRAILTALVLNLCITLFAAPLSAQQLSHDYDPAMSAVAYGADRAGPNRTVEPEAKRLDVDAMLKIATIGDPKVIGWLGSDTTIAHLSPDESQVVVVVQEGDPDGNSFRGRLLLFQTSAILAGKETPSPETLVEFESRTNFQPIAGLRWVDNTTLVFAGVEGDDPVQIYRFDLQTRSLARITSEDRPVVTFSTTKDLEDVLVLTYADQVQAKDKPECLTVGCLVSPGRLTDAINSAGTSVWYPGEITHYGADSTRRQLTSLYDIDGISDCFPNHIIPGGLSPDGGYALFFCGVSHWPEWWSEYTVDPQFSERIDAEDEGYAHQYMLLDVRSDEIRPLSSAPFLRFSQPFSPIWIDGGERVLLLGAVEPLVDVSETERKTRASRLGVIAVDPRTGETEFAFELDNKRYRRVANAEWNQSDRILKVDLIGRDGSPDLTLALQASAKGWTRVKQPKAAEAPRRVTFEVSESPNDRPVLFATDTSTGARYQVFDPNPWLAGYDLGHVEEIKWQSAGGYNWDGAIYYPTDYIEGQRYPLVILTHGYRPGKFSPYGYQRNYAAQPLASAGIIVLQMAETGLNDVIGTPAELPRSREGYESAIDELASRGLIDRERVGLVGFSRTAWYSNFMATHSEYPIAATMITDGGDIGWWGYMSYNVIEEMDQVLGASSFGEGLEAMLETAPTFSLNRWRAPMLMWSAGEDVIDLWDVYVGLRHLQVPVEFWHFPDGTHDLIKMSHRRVGSELMVDWFGFWLKDELSGDHAKSEQNARWQEMRILADRVASEPRPPLLDWSAEPRPR